MSHPPREPVNGWIHFGGAVLAGLGLAVLAVEAHQQASARHLVAAVIFGASAVLLFAASANYHLRPASGRARLYQRLDHSAIYVFIAGTYTPICVIALWHTLVGPLLLAAVWTLAAAGVLHAMLARRRRRGVATLIYLGLGWAGVVAVPTLLDVAPPALGGWIITGGVLYSAGAYLYWRRWPRRRWRSFSFHELWHASVLAASASHYWAILTYVMPMP